MPDDARVVELCARLDAILTGPARATMVDDAAMAPTLGAALARLAGKLRVNAWPTPDGIVHIEALVQSLDRATRAEGFHALHDWDGVAGRVNPDTIAVDVLSFVAGRRGADPVDRAALAIVLDYHVLNLLALASLRVWDTSDPDAALDRLQTLLDHLQNGGSGQRFAADAATLLLIATCHYEPNEDGYRLLLERVRTLDVRHRRAVALGHASSMGCHLRFGLSATYGGSVQAMRDDNVADYPWLAFAMAELTEFWTSEGPAFRPGLTADHVLESILNGLTPDPAAFLDVATPAALAACNEERLAVRQRVLDHRDVLIAATDAHRPRDAGFSPLALFFNFSHNVIKGAVVDAALWGEPRAIALNDLLTALPHDDATHAPKRALATTLMRYAQASPDQVRGRPTPAIVYDPYAGRRTVGDLMRALRGA
jgi:hypothetical protein